jgi:putative DNA methylase
MPHPEIITRRHLPHWYVPGAAHFITYRLAGTIPTEVLERLRIQHDTFLNQRPADGVSRAQHRALAHKRFFGAYDRYLDTDCKIDWLSQPPVAAMIRGNLYHHNGGKYHLLAYRVMSNHVHVLLQPIDLVELPALEDQPGQEESDAKGPLASIMHSLKSYTANRANELLARSGSFWQGESYDHWVRDEDELERIIDYIRYNPVKAGLVREPHHWFFCSAHDRFLTDGSCCGLLRDFSAS